MLTHVSMLEREWDLKPASLRRKMTKRELEDGCAFGCTSPGRREENPTV
jgi:hypothetical protein